MRDDLSGNGTASQTDGPVHPMMGQHRRTASAVHQCGVVERPFDDALSTEDTIPAPTKRTGTKEGEHASVDAPQKHLVFNGTPPGVGRVRLKGLSHPFYDFDSHPVCGMRPISAHASITEPSISCTRYAPGGEVQLCFSRDDHRLSLQSSMSRRSCRPSNGMKRRRLSPSTGSVSCRLRDDLRRRNPL